MSRYFKREGNEHGKVKVVVLVLFVCIMGLISSGCLSSWFDEPDLMTVQAVVTMDDHGDIEVDGSLSSASLEVLGLGYDNKGLFEAYDENYKPARSKLRGYDTFFGYLGRSLSDEDEQYLDYYALSGGRGVNGMSMSSAQGSLDYDNWDGLEYMPQYSFSYDVDGNLIGNANEINDVLGNYLLTQYVFRVKGALGYRFIEGDGYAWVTMNGVQPHIYYNSEEITGLTLAASQMLFASNDGIIYDYYIVCYTNAIQFLSRMDDEVDIEFEYEMSKVYVSDYDDYVSSSYDMDDFENLVVRELGDDVLRVTDSSLSDVYVSNYALKIGPWDTDEAVPWLVDSGERLGSGIVSAGSGALNSVVGLGEGLSGTALVTATEKTLETIVSLGTSGGSEVTDRIGVGLSTALPIAAVSTGVAFDLFGGSPTLDFGSNFNVGNALLTTIPYVAGGVKLKDWNSWTFFSGDDELADSLWSGTSILTDPEYEIIRLFIGGEKAAASLLDLTWVPSSGLDWDAISEQDVIALEMKDSITGDIPGYADFEALFDDTDYPFTANLEDELGVAGGDSWLEHTAALYPETHALFYQTLEDGNVGMNAQSLILGTNDYIPDGIKTREFVDVSASEITLALNGITPGSWTRIQRGTIEGEQEDWDDFKQTVSETFFEEHLALCTKIGDVFAETFTGIDIDSFYTDLQQLNLESAIADVRDWIEDYLANFDFLELDEILTGLGLTENDTLSELFANLLNESSLNLAGVLGANISQLADNITAQFGTLDSMFSTILDDAGLLNYTDFTAAFTGFNDTMNASLANLTEVFHAKFLDYANSTVMEEMLDNLEENILANFTDIADGINDAFDSLNDNLENWFADVDEDLTEGLDSLNGFLIERIGGVESGLGAEIISGLMGEMEVIFGTFVTSKQFASAQAENNAHLIELHNQYNDSLSEMRAINQRLGLQDNMLLALINETGDIRGMIANQGAEFNRLLDGIRGAIGALNNTVAQSISYQQYLQDMLDAKSEMYDSLLRTLTSQGLVVTPDGSGGFVIADLFYTEMHKERYITGIYTQIPDFTFIDTNMYDQGITVPIRLSVSDEDVYEKTNISLYYSTKKASISSLSDFTHVATFEAGDPEYTIAPGFYIVNVPVDDYGSYSFRAVASNDWTNQTISSNYAAGYGSETILGRKTMDTLLDFYGVPFPEGLAIYDTTNIDSDKVKLLPRPLFVRLVITDTDSGYDLPDTAFLNPIEQRVVVGYGQSDEVKWNVYYLTGHSYSVKFVVYDLDGNVVYEKNIGRVTLSLDDIEQGNSDKLSIAEATREELIVEF